MSLPRASCQNSYCFKHTLSKDNSDHVPSSNYLLEQEHHFQISSIATTSSFGNQISKAKTSSFSSQSHSPFKVEPYDKPLFCNSSFNQSQQEEHDYFYPQTSSWNSEKDNFLMASSNSSSAAGLKNSMQKYSFLNDPSSIKPLRVSSRNSYQILSPRALKLSGAEITAIRAVGHFPSSKIFEDKKKVPEPNADISSFAFMREFSIEMRKSQMNTTRKENEKYSEALSFESQCHRSHLNEKKTFYKDKEDLLIPSANSARFIQKNSMTTSGANMKTSALQQNLQQNLSSESALPPEFPLQDSLQPPSSPTASLSSPSLSSVNLLDPLLTENITTWKPQAIKHKNYTNNLVFNDGDVKVSTFHASKRNEMLMRWKDEDLQDLAEGNAELARLTLAIQLGKGKDENREKTKRHEESGECVEDKKEFGGVLNEKDDEKEENEVQMRRKKRIERIKHQIQEAKEHFKLFGEWAKKDWIVDEEEKKMWEEAERKFKKKEEEEEEEEMWERKEGDKNYTLEEMMFRLQELQEKSQKGSSLTALCVEELEEASKLKLSIAKREKRMEKEEEKKKIDEVERFRLYTMKKKLKQIRSEERSNQTSKVQLKTEFVLSGEESEESEENSLKRLRMMNKQLTNQNCIKQQIHRDQQQCLLLSQPFARSLAIAVQPAISSVNCKSLSISLLSKESVDLDFDETIPVFNETHCDLSTEADAELLFLQSLVLDADEQLPYFSEPNFKPSKKNKHRSMKNSSVVENSNQFDQSSRIGQNCFVVDFAVGCFPCKNLRLQNVHYDERYNRPYFEKILQNNHLFIRRSSIRSFIDSLRQNVFDPTLNPTKEFLSLTILSSRSKDARRAQRLEKKKEHLFRSAQRTEPLVISLSK